MTHMITSFFSRNKKTIFLLGFVLLLLCQFEPSFAETTDSGTNTSFIDVIQGGLKIIASLLGVLTTLVALFLNPEWTSGTAFGLQEHLKEIWILVSNVVYFVFAMILIVIAFMNIIGKGDKWELKSALPRFIVGVLIVPFSWFFVQFVVSVSAILTIGVLTLPYDTFKDKDFFTNINSDFKICTHPVIDLGSAVDANTGTPEALKQSYSCAEADKKTIDEILNSEEGGLKNGVFGIISIYTYGILGGDAMDHITKGQLVSLKSVVDLGVKGIFDLIFIIVYCLLMFALFLALFVRGVWLWMYMMLSPAFGLLYFFEKGDEGVADGKFSIKEFISLALVPVYVCAALSFGLVFLFVASDGIGQSVKKGDAGTETLSLAGLNLTIKGFQGNSEEGVLDTAQGALSTLIIEMFGIVILWIAVMAALKSSSTTGAIIEPIDAFGKQVGSLVAKAPTYAPIIPAPGGGQSAASLQSIGSSVTSAFQNKESERGTKFMKDTFPSMSGGIDLSNKSVQTLGMLNQKGLNKEVVGNIKTTMETGKNTAELLGNDNFRELIVEGLKKTGDAEAIEMAGKINRNNTQALLDGIAKLDSHVNGTNNGDIIGGERGRFAKGSLRSGQLDEILSGGATEVETPLAGTVNKTVNIDVATGSFTGKSESEIISTLKSQIGANRITTANLEKELKDGGVNDSQITTSIKTALKDLIDDASDSDGE